MADNVAVTPGSGATIATDDVGGAQYQRVKVDLGGDGVASPLVRGQQAGADSLPVVVASDQTLTVASHAVTNAGTFAVQAAQSGTWTVQPGNTANTTAWLVTGTGGTFPVTGTFWQATQPVSGTVSITANSAVNAAQINGVTPLMGNGASGTGALRVALVSDGTGRMATVDTVTAVTAITNALPAGTNAIGKLAANSGVDIGDVDVTSVAGTVTTKETRSATAAVTAVADNAADVQLLASNANRLGASVQNDSSAVLYLCCTETATSTNYTARLVQYAYWEAPFGFTGEIRGIWATDPGDGAARVTEYT